MKSIALLSTLVIITILTVSCGGTGSSADSVSNPETPETETQPINVKEIDGQSDVDVDALFQYTFSNSTDLSNVNESTFFIIKNSTNAKALLNTTICIAESAINSNVSCSTPTCTLDPSLSLEEGTSYTICITQPEQFMATFTTVDTETGDDSGNGSGDDSNTAEDENNIEDNTNSNENNEEDQQPDVTSPTIIEVTPVENGTDTPLEGTMIVVDFSEVINTNTVTADSFYVLNPAQQKLNGTISFSNQNKRAILTLSGNLTEAYTYQATLTTVITDIANNALANEKNWSFIAYSYPIVLGGGLSPESEAMDVDINATINATFNKTMDPTTFTPLSFYLTDLLLNTSIDGLINYSDQTATLTPNTPLNYNRNYQATVTTDVEDTTGTGMQNPRTWTFKTSPNLADTLEVRTSITDMAPCGISYTHRFSHDIETDTVNNTTVTLFNNILSATVPGTPEIEPDYPDSIIFTPADCLPFNANLTATSTTDITSTEGYAMTEDYTNSYEIRDGQWGGDENLINNDTGTLADLAVADSGIAVTAWTTFDDTNRYLYAKRYDPGTSWYLGEWSDTKLLRSINIAVSIDDISVAIGSNGDAMIICETNDDIETYRWLSDSENPESREYVALHQVLPTYTSFSKPSAAVEESGNILVAFYKKSANEENYRLFYNYYDNASEEWTYGSSPVTGVDIVNPIEIINGTDFDHTHPIGIVSHNTDSWVSAIYIGLTSPMIYTKHLSNGSGAASSHNITTYWDMEYFHTSINDIGDLAIFWKNGSGECGYTTYINGMWTDYGPFTGALNECHEPQGGITNTNDIIVAWKDTFTGDNTITGCTLNNGTCEEEPNTIVNNSSDYISPPIGTIDTIGNLSLFWIIESSPGIYTPQTIRLAVGKDPGNIIDLTSTDNFYRYSPITVGVDRYGRIFSLFSLQDALGDTSIEWTLFD